MSYDIYLKDKKTNETVLLDRVHDITGGTYALGGTNEAWLNITYNYAKFFGGLGDKGVRTLYGMTAKDSIPLLKKVINDLGDDVSKDYWEATEGNAKKALEGLLYFAEHAPEDAVWEGD